MTNEFYIYAYLRSDGSPYYIGKGKNRRAWDKGAHTIKPPVDHTLIVLMETHLTEVGALALERFYIRWYGRKDIGTGILRNMTDGGDGSQPGPQIIEKIKNARSKQIITDKTKEKLKYVMIERWKNVEYREKMVSILTEVNRNPEKRKKCAHTGKRSAEWVEKQAKTLRGRPNSVSKTVWYNNGINSIRCKEGYAPEGCNRGRIKWKKHG